LILVTSDVARRTFAQGSLYCMSKYAQDALALTLRKELRPHGVRVSVVMPGLTDTSFGGSEEGAPHKAEWLKPQDVAQTIAFMANAPQHVVIDEVLIHPFCQDYQA
jgi:NADP-dependent 3-hydroxy acid dehydrogenase YdfG